MVYFLYLISILYGLWGIWAILSPRQAMRQNVGLKNKMPHRLRGLVTLAVAVLLWQAAVVTTNPLFVMILAACVAFKGAWLLTMSDASHEKLMRWAGSFSPLAIRFFGALAVALFWYLYKIVIFG